MFGGLNLTQHDFTAWYFYTDDRIVTIFQPGAYDVEFLLQAPANVSLDTYLLLQKNGQSLQNPIVSVTHPTGTSAICTARGILHASAGAAVRLSSSNIIQYSGDGVLAGLQLVLIEPATT